MIDVLLTGRQAAFSPLPAWSVPRLGVRLETDLARAREIARAWNQAGRGGGGGGTRPSYSAVGTIAANMGADTGASPHFHSINSLYYQYYV